MAITTNTILITGGSSGLGLEMAKRFSQLGNKVIICSRSAVKLSAARQQFPDLITYPCDISQPKDCGLLKKWLEQNYPETNILINNAGIVHKTDFITDGEVVEKAEKELSTNLVAPIRLTKLLLPFLLSNQNARIINITSGLVYVSRADYPFYNATKAALHSFTQVLRHQLREKPVQVVEVFFPAVDTPWHKGNPPKIAIPPEKAVAEMLKGLDQGKEEIRVGGAKLLYRLSRIAPKFAFKKLNNLVQNETTTEK
ncbi:SDR family NAD(P)-dependent oxidoreductase [Sinomicrobium pectinilyticum]|uniref:SDR family NAD(P)-dependent oxidoreductase n=1 Tax=Sinomicrobium pectinilyticum TaxID=1084421 RepID=A0A3N0ERK6_SINP1|nr:SDR family NAD(P)-dependent oxidoreductase [Sinomicrobium pectinilyticum]RNL90391.1 SDR family NAD(P)-dependent oxidoreductase [Sinomicrobium pectinilyticum]